MEEHAHEFVDESMYWYLAMDGDRQSRALPLMPISDCWWQTCRILKLFESPHRRHSPIHMKNLAGHPGTFVA